jgi:hypothetical protein
MGHADQKDERNTNAVVQLWIDDHELEQQHDEQYEQETIFHLGSKKKVGSRRNQPFYLSTSMQWH